jgi:uncharacterized protein (TIGR04255 family)
VTEAAPLAFGSPPIWELGITIGNAQGGYFNAYDVREVHDLFRDRFPTAEKQLAAMERVFPGGPQAPSQMPVLQFGPPPDLTRWWFVSEDGADVLQVQDNFLARNWRRLVPPPSMAVPYPGFDGIYAQFRADLARLGEWSATRGRALAEPSHCELLYDNLIPQKTEDGSHVRMSDIIRPVQFDPPLPSAGFTLNWFERIEPARLPGLNFQVTIAQVGIPKPDGTGEDLYVKLTLIAHAQIEAWQEAYEFIEMAHGVARKKLVDLTTDECRTTWGQS